MAVKHVDLDDCYIPKTNNKEIVADVEIGDGQEGSYSIFLGSAIYRSKCPGKTWHQGRYYGQENNCFSNYCR